MPRLAFVVNSFDFLRSHRLVLAQGAMTAGFEVVAVGPSGTGEAQLEALGIRCRAWRMGRKSQDPRRELDSAVHLAAVLREERVDLLHNVTIKPVLYGSAAAAVLRRPAVVNAISGLGYVFLARGLRARARRRAVTLAYRFATSLPRSAVVLQNDDDEADLRHFGALGGAPVIKIRGSGVDLQRFSLVPLPEGTPVVVLPSRLLWDKGVREFVDAARMLRKRGCQVRMVLVGGLDAGNPAAVSEAELQRWVADGTIEAWGHRADMPEVLRQATIVCLPSYREGIPKALLEAAARGRPIVTTDAPGCRDVVEGGRLGTLVPTRDGRALAAAIEALVLDRSRCEREGQALAAHAVANFSDATVLAQHLVVYDRLLRAGRP